MAAAWSLANAGWGPLTVVERGSELGGLAGTFHREEHFYPLAYHHILKRDATLLRFLDLVGALPRVRWRKIRMLFRVDGRLYDLGHPRDFLRFPMSLADKLRFARLMARTFAKTDWSDWSDRAADELVDRWGGPGVREAIFEPLARLKFERPSAELSAAWLGARLHFREGSSPLGFIPGANWTKVLCDGLTERLRAAGIELRTESTVAALTDDGSRLVGVELKNGERLGADRFVSTLPTEVYRSLAPRDRTDELDRIRYTAIVSLVCATRQRISPDFYWMNLASPRCSACGLFRLESLNPTIGGPDESSFNFVTHVPSRHDAFFRRDDEELIAGYKNDFRSIFGVELQPAWTHLARLPMYSPVFLRGYRNPPVRSRSWPNVFFAGNYRTFPSIASTGTALQSGLDAAAAALAAEV